KREALRILRDIIPDLPVLDKGASRDGLRYVGRGRSILRISLNEDQHRRLEKIRFDLAKNDRMQDWAGVFEQLLQELERANTQDKCLKVLPETVWQHYESDSRYIPRGLKVLILKKADNRCMFIGTNGRRCSQTRFLEIDHIRPLARGGLTRLDNLQVLCKSHNLFKGSSLQLPNLSP
ncbi:MAG: HNH endonuclease signature motif containing protein, partial [Proteobacteria bacterium]|nr:HNH endonuclease signature motif containing protein [Pseudomonadota bacterium]